MKGKALRRALESSDALRIGADVPLLTDVTELITPDIAQAMLRLNKSNRPINWKKVEEYAAIMARGEWELHSQGIILDSNGNILTGQKRLWAVVYSGVNVPMRISRGNPARVARLLDRGTPQSARDLASRGTGKKHGPTEASIARAYCAAMGNIRPSVDILSEVIEANAGQAEIVLAETVGTKKTRTVLMVLGAICAAEAGNEETKRMASRVDVLADELDHALAPQTSAQCWGKGAAFGLAMDVARRVVSRSCRR